MIKTAPHKLIVKNKVIDFEDFEIREKTTNKDLDKYYDFFVEKAPCLKEYFEDYNGFDQSLREASKEKKPKIIARDPFYPSSWKYLFMPWKIGKDMFPFLYPKTRRFDDRKFKGAHCILNFPLNEGDGKRQSINPKFSEDLEKKLQQFPDYEGIIEVGNDRNKEETKGTLFHEGLHYLIGRYFYNTGRRMLKEEEMQDLSDEDRIVRRYLKEEGIVNLMTDKLLQDDKESLFEHRWQEYTVWNFNYSDTKGMIYGLSALPTGLALGLSLFHPWVLPLAFAPGRIRDYFFKKHKESKREKLLKHVEYPKFKI